MLVWSRVDGGGGDGRIRQWQIVNLQRNAATAADSIVSTESIFNDARCAIAPQRVVLMIMVG